MVGEKRIIVRGQVSVANLYSRGDREFEKAPQCFSQMKFRSAAVCVTTLPLLSAGVSPSSDACVREWLK